MRCRCFIAFLLCEYIHTYPEEGKASWGADDLGGLGCCS